MTTEPKPTLPPPARELVDCPEFATVATKEPDGSVQLTVVWIKRDGDDLLFSTTKTRRKVHNLGRDPRATILIYSSKDPQTYLEVRGHAEIEDDPQSLLIHELVKKYTGAERYSGDDGTDAQRVVVRLKPNKVLWRT